MTYLGPHDSQIGHKESMKDTARVLSRFYDAIEFRGAGQEIVDALVEFSDVPIYNGLTNEIHPTQFLADALTMLEHVDKPASQIAFCYIGDCRFNTADTLLIGGAQLGMDVRLCGPQALWPAQSVVDCAHVDRRARPARASPSPRTARRPSRASTSSTPTSGCRWASRSRSGASASSC